MITYLNLLQEKILFQSSKSTCRIFKLSLKQGRMTKKVKEIDEIYNKSEMNDRKFVIRN